MSKIKELANRIISENLIECESLFADILKEKCLEKLEEKKLEIISEGDIKLFNKKKKNRNEVRAGRSVGAIQAKHTGRTMFRSLPSNQMKAILATEGVTKAENKKHKGEVEARIGASLEKDRFVMGLGSSKKSKGRQAEKTLPSEVIKAHSKKAKPVHWSSTIGLYGHPVAEEYIEEAKPMDYSDVHKILVKNGFSIDRQKGSHITYKHKQTGTTQSVVHHGKMVSVGIVRQIMDKIKSPELLNTRN